MKDYGLAAELFKALGDAKRLFILNLLTAGEQNATALLAELDIGQPTLSHHMKLLHSAGLVKADIRGRNTVYSLSPLGQAALSAAESGFGFDLSDSGTGSQTQPVIHTAAKRGVRL